MDVKMYICINFYLSNNFIHNGIIKYKFTVLHEVKHAETPRSLMNQKILFSVKTDPHC